MRRLQEWAVRRAAHLGRASALVAALAAFAPALAQTTAPAYTPGEESPEEFPPGPGRDEAFYACIACHNFKLVAAQGMGRERWDETLTFMTVRHSMPEVSGEDRKLILDYLASAFPERAQPQRGWRNPFAR